VSAPRKADAPPERPARNGGEGPGGSGTAAALIASGVELPPFSDIRSQGRGLAPGHDIRNFPDASRSHRRGSTGTQVEACAEAGPALLCEPAAHRRPALGALDKLNLFVDFPGTPKGTGSAGAFVQSRQRPPFEGPATPIFLDPACPRVRAVLDAAA